MNYVATQAVDLDRRIWDAQNALFDLCNALKAATVITETQLGDLEALMRQAKRAQSLGQHTDLPAHEFNRSNS